MVLGAPLTADEWEAKAKSHIEEAKFLLNRRRYLPVYRDVGFAVECALKAVIMRKHGLNGWPSDAKKARLGNA